MIIQKDYQKAEELIGRFVEGLPNGKLSTNVVFICGGLYLLHLRGGITCARIVDLLSEGPNEQDRENLISDVARCIRIVRRGAWAIFCALIVGLLVWVGIIAYLLR